MAHLHQGTREAIDEALPLFYKAIELDPDFASAYGDGGVVPFLAQGQWLDDRSRAGDRRGRAPGAPGGRAGQGRCGRAHARRPCARASRRRPRRRHRACSTGRSCSIRTSPPPGSSADSCRVWRGEPDGAIEHFARAMRFSPLDPEMYRMQAGMALAHLFAGRFDAASSWAEKAYRDLPSFLMVVGIIAASHALAGRTDDAKQRDAAPAPARSRAAHLQSQGLASDPPAGGSRDASRRACGQAGLPE